MTSRGATVIIAGGMVTQQLLVFATSILTARHLGVENFGVLTILKGLQTAALLVTPIGFDLSLLKYGGVLATNQVAYRSLYIRARGIVLLINTLLTLLFYFFLAQFILGTTVGNQDASRYALITFVGVSAAADMQLMNAILRARHRPAIFSLVSAYLVPTARIILIGIGFFFLDAGLEYVIYVNSIVFIVGALLLSLIERTILFEKASSFSGDFRTVRYSTFLAESAWMALSLVTYGGMRFLDVLFLGAFVSTRAAGEYGALSMIAQVIQIYPMAISQTIGPDIAALHKNGDFKGIEDRLRQYRRNAGLVSGFLFGGIAAFGDKLDLVFGPDFAFSYPLSLTLAAGWFIGALYSPMGYALSMGGLHRLESLILNVGAVLLVTLLYVLIDQLASVGAALAVLVGFLFINITRARLVSRIFNITIFEVGDFVPAMVFLAIGGVLSFALEVSHLRSILPATLACILYTILCAYVGHHAFLTESERLTIRRILLGRK